MRDQKQLNNIIRKGVVDALTELGNPQHGDDLRTWLLKKEQATPADWGMTPPNAKYPEGRYRFTLSFTLVCNDLKKKGILFSPRRGYYSTEPDATVAEKPSKKVAKSAKKAISAPVEVETPSEEVISAPVEAEKPSEEIISAPVEAETPSQEPVEVETPSEEIISAPVEPETPSQEPIEAENPSEEIISAPVEVDEPSEEIISAPVEVDEPSEEIISAPVEVETPSQEIISAPVEPETPSQEPIEAEKPSEEIISAPVEAETPSEEIISTPIEVDEPSETPSDEPVEVDEPSEEIISAPIEADDEMLDDLFDDEPTVTLNQIAGSPLYGALQDDTVLISDDESLKVVFDTDAPSDWVFANDKHKLILQKAKAEGLTQYGKIVVKVAEKTAEMGFHDGNSPLGCFGKGNAHGDFCYSRCPLGALCKTSRENI